MSSETEANVETLIHEPHFLDSKKRTGVLCCLAAAVLWSLSGVYSAFLVGIEAHATIVIRNSVCGLFFILLSVVLERRRFARFLFDPNSWLIGCFSAIASVGYVWALLLAPSANVLTIYATNPIFAAGFLWLIYRVNTSWPTIVSSIGAITGVIIIVSSDIGDKGTNLGNMLAVGMTAATALVLVLMQKHKDASSLAVSVITCILSVVATAPFADYSGINPTIFLMLSLYGLSGGVAFLLFMIAAKRLTSSETGLLATSEVAFAPLWIWLMFGTALSWTTLSGAIVILGSVFSHIYSGSIRAKQT